MRLLHLHVENFGTLSNYDVDLQAGLNEALRENGWGKTTLAAFIRVMFYGLDGERKRDYSENDRMKFKPWNQGYFGGTMEFEAGGKRYLVTRNFGQKEKDGTFLLQDAETLLESHDYSERLGEELFGIDRESFERTSFIDRDVIRYRGINSVISSKVGSASQTDDLSYYDAAQELMKNFLNAYSPKKKTGELYKLEDEIRQLERDAGNAGLIQARIDGIKQQREQEKAALEKIKTEQERLQAEDKGLSDQMTKAVNLRRRQKLTEVYENRRAAVEKMKREFGSRIPTREELQQLQTQAEKSREQRIRLSGFANQPENERLQSLRKYFRNGVPQEYEMTAQIEKCNSIQNRTQQMQNLEGLIEKENLKLEGYRMELQRLEVASGLEAAKKRKKQGLLMLLGILLTILGILAGVGTFLLHWNQLVYVPAAISLVVGIVILMIPLLRRSVQESVPFGEEQMLRRQIQEGMDHLTDLEKDAREQEKRIGGMEEELREFFESRELTYDRAKAEGTLYEIKNRVREYEGLLQEEKEKEFTKKKLSEESGQIDGELKKLMDQMELRMDKTDHAAINGWISETLQRLTAYEKECREEMTAKADLDAFEKEHPELEAEQGKLLSEEEIRQREEEIRETRKRLAEEETKIHENVSAYNRNLEDAYADAESLREKQERIDVLSERREEEKKRYHLVEKTQEYLKTAKERFIAKYVQPIKTAFDGYYRLLTGAAEDDGSEFQIDADVNIFRKEAGEYHGVETQSEGFGEVIGLCIRMALLDVMYEKERPLVIMDDPFAGLDEEHLNGAKAFLEKVSQRYQILYLTCHESRM